MKTIGLLGGMSWESTQFYYRFINRAVQDKLGGVHSAHCIIYSFDFADIEALQAKGEWAASGDLLGEAGRKLREAGCDFLVLCTNTMHKVADDIERISGLRLLHIADPTIAALKTAGVKTVALLATRYTMEQPFYRERLERTGLRVLIPNDTDRTRIHDIIYEELVRGIVLDESRNEYLAIVERLRGDGAEGIILGCTEIDMLLHEGDSPLPFFDTTALHALAAVEEACAV
jgi:aspartate racemase